MSVGAVDGSIALEGIAVCSLDLLHRLCKLACILGKIIHEILVDRVN